MRYYLLNYIVNNKVTGNHKIQKWSINFMVYSPKNIKIVYTSICLHFFLLLYLLIIEYVPQIHNMFSNVDHDCFLLAFD